MTTTPSRLVLRLLSLALPRSQREAFVGDVLEEFAARADALGMARARRWLWRQTVAAFLVRVPSAHRRVAAPALPPGDPLVSSFLADLRHGARLLRRAPGFTLLATLTLGLGIGTTTAIFSVVDPVLIRSLPYPSAERLVTVWERDAEGDRSNTGYATFLDLATSWRAIDAAAVSGDWQPTISGDGSAERLTGRRVSWRYFDVLGVRPAIGRGFVESDDVQGRHHVVVIGHGLWRRRFGGDSAIVGRAIPIDGVPHVVVGVLPAGFDDVLAPDAQIWRVLGYDTSLPWACRTCRHLQMVARLRAGVHRSEAAADLARIAALVVAAHPTDYPSATVSIVPLQEQVTEYYRPVLLAVSGATLLVLLIAAADVANLQLARSVRRHGEFAVRAALGAGSRRLARQLLAEGLLLATLGGLAGLVVAWLTLPALVARLPQTLPRLAAVRLDATALAVGACVTLVLGVALGLAPAFQGAQASVFEALRGGTRVGPARRFGVRAGLVVSEIAIALMLLAGAGLLSRSLVRLMSVDVGFDPAGLLTMQVQATGPRYANDAAVFANHDRIREAVRAVPGVASVGIASQLPLSGNVDGYGVVAEDRTLANPELAPSADRYTVSSDFMRTMGIAILRGRAFGPADDADSAHKVVIVSAALAARIWPGEEPMGKRVRLGGPDRPWREVVGVARNVRHSGLDAVVTNQVYIPERQWLSADDQVTLVVRATGSPAAIAAAVRRAVSAVDPAQPVTRLATMEQIVATSTAQRRLARLLFAAFAGVALLLAAAGIYGALAGAVAERTREIGLRSALGATPGQIIGLVLREGTRLTTAGLVLGAVGAAGLGRVIRGLLYGVQPVDPITLGAVAALLTLVAVAACLIPARRALRVDPVTALRAD